MDADPYKCKCGGDMGKRSSRLDRKAGLMTRYLVCKACGAKRQLLVEPEKILAVLSSQQIAADAQDSITTSR